MELPHDIWDIIVKESKKDIHSLIDELTDTQEITALIYKLTERKQKITLEYKSKFENGDIVIATSVTRDTPKRFVITDLAPNSTHPIITLRQVHPNPRKNTYGEYGYYITDMEWFRMDINKFKLHTSKKDREKILYEYINELHPQYIIRYFSKPDGRNKYGLGEITIMSGEIVKIHKHTVVLSTNLLHRVVISKKNILINDGYVEWYKNKCKELDVNDMIYG
tara:strand:- start:31 stop:696 length:666 start_codon:yes stop_codon:yes gene_type:complete